ncbi:MAG: cation:proton antiporter [Phycisphaerae bacterium]|nr:cation:proton antiporter [Phycisphaerae bacterium]
MVILASQSNVAVGLLAILAAAGLVALVLGRLRMVTIPGYLIAGAIVGPHGLGLVRESADAAAISQLAMVVLMFTVGLHLDLGGMSSDLRRIAGVTVGATIGVLLLGWPAGRAFGLDSPASLAVAMGMAISSTAVVLRVLEARRELHLAQGRVALGVLVLQDMLALVFMASLPVLAAWSRVEGGGSQAEGHAGSMADPMRVVVGSSRALGGMILLVVVGRAVLPRLIGAAARAGNEVMLVISAAVALAAAMATSWLGFSPELGAFLAGFLLATTPFRYQLAGQLVPMRDLFMAIFFAAIGLEMPLTVLASDWWIIGLGVVATVGIKAAATGAAGWLAGLSVPMSAYAALALAQGGEFTLLIVAQARGSGVLTPSQASHVIAVTVISLVVTPWLVGAGRAASVAMRRLPPAPWARAEDEGAAAASGSAASQLVIVAGFGPVGRAVVDAIEKRGAIVTVVELNPKTVDKQHRLGRAIVFGDASNAEVLERAGLGAASAVVLTMPDEEAVLRACRTIRLARPDILISARLNVLSRAIQAMQLGADHTVVEELATAEAMAAQVMRKLEEHAAGADTNPRLYEVERAK